MDPEEINHLAREVLEIITKSFIWLVSIHGILVTIPVSLAIYYFFRSIKRLVYILEVEEFPKENDKNNIEISYLNSNYSISNIIIYNNGLKTINRNDLKKLYIVPEHGKIHKIIETKRHSDSIVRLIGNRIEVYLDNFDKKNFIAIKAYHDSHLKVDGRIKESGELMNTESRSWLRINLFFTFAIMTGFILAVTKIEENNFASWKYVVLMIILSFICLIIFKIVDFYFFIPNSIQNTYLKKLVNKTG